MRNGLLCFACIGLSAAAAASAVGAEDSAPGIEFLKTAIITTVGARPGIELPLKPPGQAAAPAKILQATKDGLHVNSNGADLDLTWRMIGDAGVLELCRPLLAEADGEFLAADLRAAYKLGLGGSGEFQRNLTALYKKDPALAKSLDESLRGSPASSKSGSADGSPVAAGGAQTPAVAGTAATAATAATAVQWGSAIGRDGKLDRAEYVREATSFDVQTIHRGLGPDYEFFHKSAKSANEEFPTLWMPPDKTLKVKVSTGAQTRDFVYQLGEVFPGKENWGCLTQGQVFYAPDNPRDPGVDRVSLFEFKDYVACAKPKPHWWGGCHPDPALKQKSWNEAAGGMLAQPAAMARAVVGWKICALMAFKNGLIGAAGSCTSDDRNPYVMLPRQKVPTAIAITTKNEFALVTVWDIQEYKGQVAVIALGSKHEDKNCLMHTWDWCDDYPGLFNLGSFTFMKLLGYIDLPDMAAPTAISVAGNRIGTGHNLNGKYAELGAFDLNKQEIRDAFATGEDKFVPDTSGYAVVVSRDEKKAAFIDLQPLFEYMKQMYFSSPENFKKTRNVGPDPKQWPFAFEVEPACKPLVVSTQALPSSPTSVLAMPAAGKNARALIGLLDGRLAVYHVGGLADDSPANPAEIACVSVAEVGRNPTCITHNLAMEDLLIADEFIVVSRGDRELDFVRLTGDTATVFKRLRDSRMIDPVQAQVVDIHSFYAPLVTVADFKGRKLINYRFGDMRLTVAGMKPEKVYGMGPDGKAEFECDGCMDFPGCVFRVCSSNVP